MHLLKPSPLDLPNSAPVLMSCQTLLPRPLRAEPYAFFCRLAEVVAPELIGCRLVKRQTDGCLLLVVAGTPRGFSSLVFTMETELGSTTYSDITFHC